MAGKTPAERREDLANARAEALRIQREEEARRGKKAPQQVRDTHHNRRSGDK